MVSVYWRPGLPIWPTLRCNLDPDLDRLSGTISNTKPGWDKETFITSILPHYVICSNSYNETWDSCSPSCSSMTLQVIKGIWYDTSRNQTRTISSRKVNTTKNVTHHLRVNDFATSYNRRPVIRAATVLAPYWAPCLSIIALLRIHAPVKDRDWSNHPISFWWSLCRDTSN